MTDNPLKSLTNYSRAVASSFPQHKHMPPDIKHHRVPAPEMSFAHPNLLVLVQEIEELVKA